MLMDVFRFFFGNFWRWLGATIMLAVICGGLRGLFTLIVARSSVARKRVERCPGGKW